MPNVDMPIRVWDHDCGGASGNPDPAGTYPCDSDDPIGLEELANGAGVSFLGIARSVGSAFTPGNPIRLQMPLDANGDGISDVQLDLQFALKASKCALAWAEKYGSGTLEIRQSMIPTVSGSPARHGTC